MPGHTVRRCARCLQNGADRGHARQAGPNRDLLWWLLPEFHGMRRP